MSRMLKHPFCPQRLASAITSIAIDETLKNSETALDSEIGDEQRN